MKNSTLYVYLEGTVHYYCGWNTVKGLECPILTENKSSATLMSSSEAERVLNRISRYYNSINIKSKYMIETNRGIKKMSINKELLNAYIEKILCNNPYVKEVEVNLRSYNGSPYYALRELCEEELGETYYLWENGISGETRGKTFEEYLNYKNALWIKNPVMFSYYLSK